MATIQGLTKDGMLAIAAEINTKVSKSGDTMTGALVLPADPTAAMQAATKHYVDNVAINTANLVDIDYIKFDPTYAGGSTQVGMLSWDQDNETLEFMLDDHVTLQIGQEHVMRVKNSSGSVAIPERTVVMFSGATGDTIAVAPAVSNGTVNVNYLAGITTEEIPADGFGFVTQLGFINQVNTDSWPVGTILYVDPTVAGGLTSVEPEIPSWTMPVAAVTKQNASSGRLLVRAIPGGSGAGGSGVVISDTKPAGGTKGDMWYDSNDGTLYVYYEDANSSQWVQIQANSALDASVLQRVGALEASNIAQGTLSPNYLINGAFDIWQRGTSGFTSGYFADRWFLNGSNNGARSTDVPNNNFAYSAAAWNASAAYAGITQRLESADAKNLVGKYVTVSGWFKRTGTTNGGTLNINMDYPNALDNYSSTTYVGSVTWASTAPSTSWVRYSATFTMPVPNQAVNGIQFSFTHNGSSGNNLGGLWTGLQVEVGTTATSFRRNQNSTQSELATCQRYYQVYGGEPTNIVIGQGCVTTSTNTVINIPLLVEMRSAPTFSYGPLSEFRQHVPGVVISTPTAISLNISSTKLISVNTSATSGFTPGHAVRIDSAGANGKFYFSSEL